MASSSNENIHIGSQFTDLSATIMTTALGNTSTRTPDSGFRAPSDEVNTANGNIDVMELVADEALVVQRSLEDKVRKMVQDEMAEVRKTIGDLAKAVNLAKGTNAGTPAAIGNNTGNGNNVPGNVNNENRANPRNENAYLPLPNQFVPENSIPPMNFTTQHDNRIS
ncbi:hypothetical protein FF38_14031 [Lucilia cuprina]|uniref:Uncharacterized protein n=1 Tax=Lucilia cuprina TaxID=7375 RepID=A0A0L0BS62_LUCCU|nr:hypothetical protein FF38_14031 [Lucilia cuprina]